ncbi:glycoside hydrolase family 16 protein [Phytoactinopolyspora limicola]|uniref:glycoside hydrolase family 16 protein n=1 Tax=Phytoactinopolyspora limicola TaxID=2715536 RepID=UPI00140D5272|nr:glycoside hydrolase family 16 protein [Phytoactinopolyspora limicola]
MVAALIPAMMALFVLLTVPASMPYEEDPGDIPVWGVPAWRDEFTGDIVDPHKWTVWDRSTHGSYSWDWAVLSADAVTVDDGMLRIEMTQLDTSVYSGEKERWWRTGALDTAATHNEQFGRWEIRAKIPTAASSSSGVWPAFWLRNGPALGEIDIMEAWGDPTDRPRSPDLAETSTLTLHERTVAPFGERAAWTYEHHVPELSPPYTTAGDFHTWAIEYTPTDFKAFFDGVLVAHVTPDGTHDTTALPWVWEETFDSPWHMRLTLAMGDPYWTPDPPPGAAPMPAEFLVDYVRYWALPAE